MSSDVLILIAAWCVYIKGLTEASSVPQTTAYPTLSNVNFYDYDFYGGVEGTPPPRDDITLDGYKAPGLDTYYLTKLKYETCKLHRST